jgi:DNA polymerase-3 subunit delta
MNYKRFIEEIGGPKRRPAYLLTGNEPVQEDLCLTAARGAVDENIQAMNFSSFSYDDDSPGLVLTTLRTSSLFGGAKIVVYRVSPKARLRAEDSQYLEKWIEKPNKASTLILVIEKPDERFKLIKSIRAGGAAVDLIPPTRKPEVAAWLVERFAERGLSLTREGANFMIERLGMNLRTLMGEAEKISIWPGQANKRYGPRELSDLICLSSTAAVFEIGEPLALQNLDSALKAMLDILVVENHMKLAYVLDNYFLKMLQVKLFLLEGQGQGTLSDAEAARKLRLHPFYYEKLKGIARRWSIQDLSKAIKFLEECHRALVSSPAPGPALLQGLALSLGRILKREN